MTSGALRRFGRLLAVVCIVWLVAAQGDEGLAGQVPLDEHRLAIARRALEGAGDRVTADHRQAILEQRVVLGMSPTEARLAAGACFMRVEPDLTVWPPATDPSVIIERQHEHPDKSRIWLTFTNATQFPSEGRRTSFVVYFEDGRAKEIGQGRPSP